MSADLTSGRHSKRRNRNQTNKFLEAACTMIELGNLVESAGLGRIKLSDCCYNDKDNSRQGPKNESRKVADKSILDLSLMAKALHHTPCQIVPLIKKLSDIKSDLKQFSKPQCRQTVKHKDVNQLNKHAKPHSRNSQCLSPTSKKDGNVPNKALRKQFLPSNLDMAKCMQLYLLKELSKRATAYKSSTVQSSKIDLSNSSLETSKSSFVSKTCLDSKGSVKPNIIKRDIVHKRNPLKWTEPKQSSLQLKMNLQFVPSSNTVNLQIKSRQGISDNNLPFRNQINKQAVKKLSADFSISTERSVSTPSAQTSNDLELHLHKPYGKTQAVFNVYDVSPYQQPGKVKGIRSHLAFNLNVGGSPQTQGGTHPSGTRSLTPPPTGRLVGNRKVLYNSRVNMNSGSTSMQQSLSLGRTPQTGSPYGSDVGSEYETQQPSSEILCDTCLQEENALQRAKQRIVGRVGEDFPSLIFSPRAFLKKCYDKFVCNKDREGTKSVGSCTCSPFIETEQFSVEEDNFNPQCSLLERCFGQLIFRDKCIVCTENKKVGTKKYRPLNPYECEPEECIEKKPSFLFSCFQRMCKKKDSDSTKAKKKKEKKKAAEKQKKAKAREKKKKSQKKQLKAKKRGTSFITSIFMNPEEDDDRQKLLPGEGKGPAKGLRKGLGKGLGTGLRTGLFRKRGDKGDPKKGTKREDDKGKKTDLGNTARKTLATTRRGYRKATRRIRERYYRNKKLAEEQKGRYACDFYLMSLRNKPCLWVYYMCPVCYPHCLQLLNVWKQISDLLLFFVAIIVWSPCILCAECLKIVACNMCVT